tara:strand:+ start:20488 stop:23814 length:3327 start_codon:yes stop_codon:yes gene_type:complete
MNRFISFLLLSVFVLLFSCKTDFKKAPTDKNEMAKRFNPVPASSSGLDFINKLEETVDANYFKYNYIYIGGGVAAADFNNDGLEDLFFISNSLDNKLYLNKGDFKFEDITEKAGITKRAGFDTGVSVADINNDGYLDIYISRGGSKNLNNSFANMLYINNGDLTFTEQADALGLADKNRTIQATFFDYDNDNDLDVYVSNTPNVTGMSKVLDLNTIQNDPKTLELKGCDRLYNNDGSGHFTDVSEKAGLQYDIGFGLNPQVGDLNNDGWLDIYVSNDFNIPDLAYLNNGNGSFTESRDKLVKHMSFNSMGSDIVDVNNDGLLDLMTLDMNPQDYVRSKTTMAMTSVDEFELMVEKKYHYQYMHNMLQLNNGNGTFSEIGKMAGMANTDWSWSLLSADFDLDGFNDIYITNGVFRDVMDRDKINAVRGNLRANRRKPTDEDFLSFAKMLPQQKLNNYFYKNNGDLTFEDVSLKWTDSLPTFSNGAIYSDLDNDGDLDIVVNNINDLATLLKNNTTDNSQVNYLKIALSGPEKNKFGIGTTIKIELEDGTRQMRQLINTRGFLSSVSNILHFGLAEHKQIKKLEVIWPDGNRNEHVNIDANQLLKINYTDSKGFKNSVSSSVETPIFQEVVSEFSHKDPYFKDYNLQILLPHKLSQTGPALAKADVNGDGLDDVFIGGGQGQASQLLLGTVDGELNTKNTGIFKTDSKYEDQGACFLDVDNDGDQDLYVVSGSYEFYETPELLQDRLYLNNGKGQFSKSILPLIASSGSVVIPADYDNDGDIDLFVGGRVIPGKYPHKPISYLLTNNQGKFTITTKEFAPDLERIGMVTDAVWVDINNDNHLDLIVAGEWMGIEVFINQENKLIKDDSFPSLGAAVGWWNKIVVADIDNDGDKDIIAGNLGLNYKFHASKEKPFHIYTTDFDYNGTEDIMLAKDNKGREVPIRGKSCMTQQLPYLAQKITTYNQFASLDLKGIVGHRLSSALHYKAVEFQSGIFINNGHKNFKFSPFDHDIQRTPINSIIYDDFNADGIKDLILAGNNYHSEVETTRSDAGIGSFLRGLGSGQFSYMPNLETGFFADKDVRKMTFLNLGEHKLLFVANNDSKHDVFKVNN